MDQLNERDEYLAFRAMDLCAAALDYGHHGDIDKLKDAAMAYWEAVRVATDVDAE